MSSCVLKETLLFVIFSVMFNDTLHLANSLKPGRTSDLSERGCTSWAFTWCLGWTCSVMRCSPIVLVPKFLFDSLMVGPSSVLWADVLLELLDL